MISDPHRRDHLDQRRGPRREIPPRRHRLGRTADRRTRPAGPYVDQRRGSKPHLLAGARTPVPARRGTVPALRSRGPGSHGHLRRRTASTPASSGPTTSMRGQKAGRHPDRTQPCGQTALPHDRRNRHQRQPDGVRPRAAQPRLPRAWPRAARSTAARLLEAFPVRCTCGVRYAQLERGERETLQRAYRERDVPAGRTAPLPAAPTARRTEAAIEGVLPSRANCSCATPTARGTGIPVPARSNS